MKKKKMGKVFLANNAQHRWYIVKFVFWKLSIATCIGLLPCDVVEQIHHE